MQLIFQRKSGRENRSHPLGPVENTYIVVQQGCNLHVLRRRGPQDVLCLEHRAICAAQPVVPSVRSAGAVQRNHAGLTRPHPARHRAFGAEVTLHVSGCSPLRQCPKHSLRTASIKHERGSFFPSRFERALNRLDDRSTVSQRAIVGAENGLMLVDGEACDAGSWCDPVLTYVAVRPQCNRQKTHAARAGEEEHGMPRVKKGLRQPEDGGKADASADNPDRFSGRWQRESIAQRPHDADGVSLFEIGHPSCRRPHRVIEQIQLDGASAATQPGDAERSTQQERPVRGCRCAGSRCGRWTCYGDKLARTRRGKTRSAHGKPEVFVANGNTPEGLPVIEDGFEIGRLNKRVHVGGIVITRSCQKNFRAWKGSRPGSAPRLFKPQNRVVKKTQTNA